MAHATRPIEAPTVDRCGVLQQARHYGRACFAEETCWCSVQAQNLQQKHSDHEMIDTSASDVLRTLSEVYMGPHVAMTNDHAVLSSETLKKLESYTKCPFTFTTIIYTSCIKLPILGRTLQGARS